MNCQKYKEGDIMLYCAYGSNLNKEQMSWRCPNSKAVCSGVLKDWELYFNLHADIRECKGAETLVGVWEIDDKDWRALDMYEGYPNYYERKIVPVETANGVKDCVVYIMTDWNKNRLEYSRPRDNYFHTIKVGFKDFGLDTNKLYETYINQFGDINRYELEVAM
jgi:gamma-glutamylcyclotransferase (GGCT)/AIG2-like uncharacterized protein YtfP